MPKFYSDVAVPEGTKVDISSSEWVKDEDNMSSASDSHLATQQSIKAYVDSKEITSIAAFVYTPAANSAANPNQNGVLTTNDTDWEDVTLIKFYKNDATGADRSSFFDYLVSNSLGLSNPSTLKFVSNNGGVVTCIVANGSNNTSFFNLNVTCTTTGSAAVAETTGLVTFSIGVIGVAGADGTNGSNGNNGNNGADGDDGSDGAAAGFGAITATTGPIGVTAGGTNAAQTLAFTIPSGTNGSNGNDGADGDDGADGADGSDATVTFASSAELVAGTVTNKVVSPDTLRDAAWSRTFAQNAGTTPGDGHGDIVLFGSIATTLVAGGIYYYSSNASWTATNAGTANSAAAKGLLGVALGTTMAEGILLRGTVCLLDVVDTGAIGAPLFLSNTSTRAATSTPTTSGHTARIIGYLTSTTNDTAWFNPDNTFVEID